MSIINPVSLTLLFGLLLYVTLHRNRNYKKLPPGPPGIPIIGNVLQLSERNWLKFTKWKEVYGPIIHLNLAGHSVVVLGNAEVATELLDRRATIYSGRPTSIIVDIVTGGLSFAFYQNGESLKRIRKAVHKALSNNVANKYHPFQESESALMVSQLLGTPTDFKKHLHRASNSLTLSMLYGQPPIASSEDPKIKMVSDFMQRLTKAGVPGTYWVEFFTWMRFLPRWMCKWRYETEEWFVRDSEMIREFMEGVENRMNEGVQKPCFMSSLLEDNSGAFPKIESAWTAVTLYAAGADTVSNIFLIQWFLLAIIFHLNVQKKAQEELDRVVGRERLPKFGDYDNLVYVRALIKECMRWRPIGPNGTSVPQDDWYKGYFIPKDTICIPNIWAMMHDPDVYGPDVEEFRPERHLDSNTGKFPSVSEGSEEGDIAFGFGRRICVGRYVANDTMFIFAARILWAFDVTPTKDGPECSVAPDPMECFDSGLAMHSKPFQCRIVPRFEDVEKLVDYTIETLSF
ncbi:cytochrome P450 [Cyathus striatus]|nr:cytochrome P450 [Cyathus striatus]